MEYQAGDDCLSNVGHTWAWLYRESEKRDVLSLNPCIWLATKHIYHEILSIMKK